jgi:hypothetical protein
MLPHNDSVGHPDLLNSIVTITDLLSTQHPNVDHAHLSLETLTKLTEAIARLKEILRNRTDAVDSFADTGGFESLLKTIEAATFVESETNVAGQSVDSVIVDINSMNNIEDTTTERLQMQKELIQLAFSTLSHVLTLSSTAKEFLLQIGGYLQIETIIHTSQVLSHLPLRDYVFGTLFAAAIHDFTHCHVFSSMRWHLNSDDLSQRERFDRIAFKMQATFEWTEQLPNPEFIPIVISLLSEIPSDQDLGLAVCDVLRMIVNATRANQLSFFSSIAFSDIIDKVILNSPTWASQHLSQEQIDLLEDLIFSLSPLGLPLSLASSVVSTAVTPRGK